MHIKRSPDAFEKITQMGDVTLYEPAGDTPMHERKSPAHRLADCVSHVQTPRGPKPVLKTMMTTACERNCYYCPFRAGHTQTKRVTITPDDMARVFDEMQRAQVVDGLFLSSGIIKGGATAQDKIIDTAEIVRRKYGYRGYIHLKIMPGAEEAQLLRAMQLADRVSVNLEAPTAQRLARLAPKKSLHEELVVQLQRAHQLKQSQPGLRSSVVTQFVVGAVGDTDLELLALSHNLYSQMGLARAYYSSFSPVPGTPLEEVAPSEAIRERRLYQASFLLRDYAWEVEDLPFVGAGNLRTDIDPKRAWAEQNLRHAPVDLVTAARHDLLRVPGIGPKGADAIVKARRESSLRDLAQLAKLGIRTPQQMAPYVLIAGRRPPQQPRLF